MGSRGPGFLAILLAKYHGDGIIEDSFTQAKMNMLFKNDTPLVTDNNIMFLGEQINFSKKLLLLNEHWLYTFEMKQSSHSIA